MNGWTKIEIKELELNAKWLYAITKVFMLNEYTRLQNCTTSKQAWDILVTMYEGTSVIKRSMVLMLNRDFKLCIMEEDETFEIFFLASPTSSLVHII